MSDSDRILQLVTDKPGLKAKQIADELGIERKQVNSILYSKLRNKITQDASYRWWPKGMKGLEIPTSEAVPQLDTPLAKLCRYYLDCIDQDDSPGVSVFSSSRYTPDYVTLHTLPFMEDSADDLFETEDARKLLSKVRRDRGSLYLGYPLRLRHIRSRRGEDLLFVEPLLLIPFHFDGQNKYAMPVMDQGIPQLNFKALSGLAPIGSGTVIDEAIQLTEELGLNTPSEDIPDFDEILYKLRSVRPEWDWREATDPHALSHEEPLSDITEQGIYNYAVLVIGERSLFTQGLETELNELSKITEPNYNDTALGTWLTEDTIEAPVTDEEPLLHIFPLNSEQRQAVLQGLSNPLTVITGPPGTGKSQVVTSILINAAWQGKRVLFASKNNKAVDVVEVRANAIGSRPILLRLGANEYQNKLAEYLVSLLSATVSPDDGKNYKRHLKIDSELSQRFESLEADLLEVINLRNEVDKLEQQIEILRSELSADLFHNIRSLDLDRCHKADKGFGQAIRQATYAHQPFLIKLFWVFLKTGRYANVSLEAELISDLAGEIGLTVPSIKPNDNTISEWHDFYITLQHRFEVCEHVQYYFRKLDALTAMKSPEAISNEHFQVMQDLADNSEELWRYWLRMQPSRMTEQERRLLGEYRSILQKLSEGSGRKGDVLRKWEQLFPQIANILPCWAVTSLSTHRRVPFEPGFFDVVVIDEASQCDIASALPLLYRAKHAVIIGDPQQLRHITSLPVGQDDMLLSKHELFEAHLNWSYRHNSLFDLAASQCRSEDIVQLRDHHRSHADIIRFSNKHFYDGQLRIATNYKHLKLLGRDEPAVCWIDVKGEVVRPASGSALNEREAKAIVKEIERIVLQQRYSGTLGVVSPFRAQANKIKDLVYKNDDLSPHIVRMEFLADTAHGFQGDERDLMIFSPVVSSKVRDGALRFLSSNGNLFNVAITRARSALIVIGDREAAAESGVDYLSKFASHVGSAYLEKETGHLGITECREAYPPVARPERVSDWERVFYSTMYNSGIHPIPQYDIDQYTLDFALFDGERKLDIEVDGEHYHRDWDGELCRRDQLRNQRLIEMGWDVMRFWVYQIRDDMDNCIMRVKMWLDNEASTIESVENEKPPLPTEPEHEDGLQTRKPQPVLTKIKPIPPKSVAESTKIYTTHDREDERVKGIVNAPAIPYEILEDSNVIPLLYEIAQLTANGVESEELQQKIIEARHLDKLAVDVFLARLSYKHD